MARHLLPEPLATLPWRVLLPLTLLTCFGATVLYSAAGGSFWTYSFTHLLRFVVFLCMALAISRLPRDWVLTKKLALWALQEQPTWTEEHVRKVAAAFRDHWIAQPGVKGRRTDWEATWRNWVRKEPALKGSAGTSQSGGSDARWFETPQGVDAQAKQHGMRERKPDEDWRSYRVLVVRAANDRKAAEFVLADAQRFNAADLYQFARATFGDALMPVDDFAS